MAIPGFQRMMLPILELCRADVPVSTAELSAKIADHFNLTEEDRSVTIAPGRLRYKNRVSWALGQLSGAGLLEKMADGEYQITKSGKEVLASRPERLDLKFLARFPTWVEFRRTRSAKPDDEASFPSRVGRTRLNLRIPTALVKKPRSTVH
jgi:restriction system protein